MLVKLKRKMTEKINKEPTNDEIKEILRLPMDAEGDKILEERLSAFGPEFTFKEKLFILFYASPNSKLCGKINPSGKATGGSWKCYGSWAIQQPHVKKAIRELTQKNVLDKLEAFFQEDIQRNLDVISVDRSSLRKDDEFTFTRQDTGDEVTVEKIIDKPIYELNKKQRDVIADFEYDKSGNAHYVLESRSQARQNLLNYYKVFGGNKLDEDKNKTTETVVTLEGIKDKATAKISIIQHNNEDAAKAGDFIDAMTDVDEEA